MIIVGHRRNTVAELGETPSHLGVEIDVRSSRGRLVLNHDPFQGGEDFEGWLERYSHRLLVLNVKEDGLEDRVRALLGPRGIEDYFFLDQPFPTLLRTARAGDPRCALRYSEYESLETVLALEGVVRWVWVDCFTRCPLDGAGAAALRAAGFRICLVSPELQGRTDPAEALALQGQLRLEGIVPDAVCTKVPASWASWRASSWASCTGQGEDA